MKQHEDKEQRSFILKQRDRYYDGTEKARDSEGAETQSSNADKLPRYRGSIAAVLRCRSIVVIKKSQETTREEVLVKMDVKKEGKSDAREKTESWQQRERNNVTWESTMVKKSRSTTIAECETLYGSVGNSWFDGKEWAQ